MRRTLTIATLSTAMLLGLSGCGLFAHNDDEPENSASTAQVDPDDIEDGNNTVNPNTTSLAPSQDKQGPYSATELKGAATTAQSYITASLTNPELLSGKWWEQGHNMETLASLGNFSSGLKQEISKLNPEQGLGARASQSVALFLAPSDSVQASKECATQQKNCSSQPFYNTAQWSEASKKAVQVDVSASVTRNMLKDKKPTTSLDTYHYKIVLSKSKKTWVINQIQNSYVIGKPTGGKS